jgi:hypothetical protein
MRLSTPALASHTRRDKRFHPVQQEKQAKVTLEPEESVGGSRKERNALSRQFSLRFDPAPVRLKGQLHTRQDLPIPAIVSEMVELGLDNDTGKPRRLLIEGGGKILKSAIRVAQASVNAGVKIRVHKLFKLRFPLSQLLDDLLRP